MGGGQEVSSVTSSWPQMCRDTLSRPPFPQKPAASEARPQGTTGWHDLWCQARIRKSVLEKTDCVHRPSFRICRPQSFCHHHLLWPPPRESSHGG